MSKKILMKKSEFKNLLSQIMIEEGDFSENMLKEDFNREIENRGNQIQNSQSIESGDAEMSSDAIFALSIKAVKEGLENWVKNFKISRDSIQIQRTSGGAKGTNKAICSDGTGKSYYLIYKILSWDPIEISVNEIKEVNIKQNSVNI